MIYVCGLYGAGKSTLIRAVLDSMEALRSIPTHVTRPPRPGETEDEKLEYHFVDVEQYDKLRSASDAWDHTEIAGAFYGTDAEGVNRRIDAGEIFIVASPNEVGKLKEMQTFYRGNSKVIWIDTDLETSNRRLLERDGEKARSRTKDPAQTKEEADRMRAYADIVYKPKSDLEENKAGFAAEIGRIVEAWKAS